MSTLELTAILMDLHALGLVASGRGSPRRDREWIEHYLESMSVRQGYGGLGWSGLREVIRNTRRTALIAAHAANLEVPCLKSLSADRGLLYEDVFLSDLASLAEGLMKPCPVAIPSSGMWLLNQYAPEGAPGWCGRVFDRSRIPLVAAEVMFNVLRSTINRGTSIVKITHGVPLPACIVSCLEGSQCLYAMEREMKRVGGDILSDEFIRAHLHEHTAQALRKGGDLAMTDMPQVGPSYSLGRNGLFQRCEVTKLIKEYHSLLCTMAGSRSLPREELALLVATVSVDLTPPPESFFAPSLTDQLSYTSQALRMIGVMHTNQLMANVVSLRWMKLRIAALLRHLGSYTPITTMCAERLFRRTTQIDPRLPLEVVHLIWAFSDDEVEGDWTPLEFDRYLRILSSISVRASVITSSHLSLTPDEARTGANLPLPSRHGYGVPHVGQSTTRDREVSSCGLYPHS